MDLQAQGIDYSVIIVGAGPAGVGTGAVLKQMGVTDFVIVDRDEIGSTFKKWPQEMKLLTPSFPGNGFGLLDLNAVLPATSPGYAYEAEHLSGGDYADYLQKVAAHFQLPVLTGVNVLEVEKEADYFTVFTTKGALTSQFVIWAGGEFHYPRLDAFEGSDLCRHTSQISSWKNLQGDHYYVIGGYESGMDAAYHLAKQGSRVTVLSRGKPWEEDNPDPSVSLSPFTSQRLQDPAVQKQISFIGGADVTEVSVSGSQYIIHTADQETYQSHTQPIMATGFKSSLQQIIEHFYWDDDGQAALTDQDESTVSEGLFLTGPQVKHGNVIFCFIYKFRQRFAVVAAEIAGRLGRTVDESLIAYYRSASMYLDDLSCRDNSCEC